MPVDNLADFIVYIAPGFIATEIFKAFFPAKDRNAFSQLTWSIVWALIIVTFIRVIDSAILGNNLHSHTSSPLAEIRFIISLILAGVLFGLIGVLQLKARIWLAHNNEFLENLAPGRDSVWLMINDPDVDDWAVVSLSDGSKYLGWIVNYKYDPNEKDQEFLLGHARKVDEKLKELYLIDGIGVYLNTRDVISIEFVKSNNSE